jgi:RNA polymerase sigma-70 factor (ECF subfamily)
MVAEPSSLLDVVEEQIDFEQLLRTLKLLNEQQRQVLLLRFVEGFSIAETAQILQKSEGAIKALQHRSLENLRRYLQQ